MVLALRDERLLRLNGPGTCTDGRVDLEHFWSLAVEEHFYLFWPAVVYFLSRARLFGACLGLMVGALRLCGSG